MNETQFVIDGDKLVIQDDANTFKGFGYISCNNSSRLLLDYKSENLEAYQKILTTLFGGEYPVLRMIKVELGVDANTSSGTEPATMRSQDDTANVTRGAGFQLIADVKKIQPNLKTGILRWGEPGWLKKAWWNVKSNDPDQLVPENSFESMYQWYKKTIVAAYQEYGYLIDYVNPDRNENTKPMLQWIKWFSKRIKTDHEEFPLNFPIEKFNRIKIIAADQNYETNFGDYMIQDEELLKYVDAVGYHYNTDDGPQQPFTKISDIKRHEVWYSEGVAPMGFAKYRIRASAGTNIGGAGSSLDVANRIIKGYFKSRRSLYLFQPAVSAYYPGVNYTHKELITAQRPWSGFFEVDNVGLQVIKHFTDFAVTGWQENGAWHYLNEATYSGVGGTENLDTDTENSSYVTLISPEKDEFSVISVNDSAVPRKYHIDVKNMSLANHQVDIWTSQGPSQGERYDSELKQVRTVTFNDEIEFIVPAYGIVTATTLHRSGALESHYQEIVSSNSDYVLGVDSQGPELYSDDFNYSADYLESRGGTPRYITDQGGAFEVILDSNSSPVLQQMITEKERALDWEYSFAPNFSLGDDQWSDYEARATFKFDTETVQNSADGNFIAIGLRSITDVKGRLQSAPYIFKLDNNGHYELSVHDQLINFGYVDLLDTEAWHTISFTADGSTLTAVLDGQQLLTYIDDMNPTYSGRLKIGTGYYKTQIKSIVVNKLVHGSYVKLRIDDSDQNVHYDGVHEHLEGIRNSVWNRSLTKVEKDAHIEFTFDGNGFNLVGQQEQPSQLLFWIDGKQHDEFVTPHTGGDRETNLRIGSLTSDKHSVKIKVLKGQYILDAIEVLEDIDN